MPVQVKRVYEPPAPADGLRILVDRLWPRGLAKEQAKVDLWLRDIAPSDELRKWFGHRPERFEQFVERYMAELQDPQHRAALQQLQDLAKEGMVTLLFSAKEARLSHVSILADVIEREQV